MVGKIIPHVIQFTSCAHKLVCHVGIHRQFIFWRKMSRSYTGTHVFDRPQKFDSDFAVPCIQTLQNFLWFIQSKNNVFWRNRLVQICIRIRSRIAVSILKRLEDRLEVPLSELRSLFWQIARLQIQCGERSNNFHNRSPLYLFSGRKSFRTLIVAKILIGKRVHTPLYRCVGPYHQHRKIANWECHHLLFPVSMMDRPSAKEKSTVGPSLVH